LRTTAGSALALLIAGACAAPAAAAAPGGTGPTAGAARAGAAATLVAPASIAAREVVAVTATGLEPGRWAAFLASDDRAGRTCLGRLARRTARAGQPTVFSGLVPSGLVCREGVAATPAPVLVGAGYRLLICLPDGGDCDTAPAAAAPVRVVPTGRACASVVFTPASDHGAFSIRARHVRCRVARDAARGAGDGDLAYRRAGLRCRGIFDAGAPLPRTVYRCTRRGARVTFSAS